MREGNDRAGHWEATMRQNEDLSDGSANKGTHCQA